MDGLTVFNGSLPFTLRVGYARLGGRSGVALIPRLRIAYPKTQKGTDLLTDAPTSVSEAQLKELFVASTAPRE